MNLYKKPNISWHDTGSPDPRDCFATTINGHIIGIHSQKENARNQAWVYESYIQDGSEASPNDIKDAHPKCTDEEGNPICKHFRIRDSNITVCGLHDIEVTNPNEHYCSKHSYIK